MKRTFSDYGGSETGISHVLKHTSDHYLLLISHYINQMCQILDCPSQVSGKNCWWYKHAFILLMIDLFYIVFSHHFYHRNIIVDCGGGHIGLGLHCNLLAWSALFVLFLVINPIFIENKLRILCLWLEVLLKPLF